MHGHLLYYSKKQLCRVRIQGGSDRKKKRKNVERLMKDTFIRLTSGDESDRHHTQMGNELLAPIESLSKLSHQWWWSWRGDAHLTAGAERGKGAVIKCWNLQNIKEFLFSRLVWKRDTDTEGGKYISTAVKQFLQVIFVGWGVFYLLVFCCRY